MSLEEYAGASQDMAGDERPLELVPGQVEPEMDGINGGVLTELGLVVEPGQPGQHTATGGTPSKEFTPDPRVVILQSEGEDPVTQRRKEIAFTEIVEEFGGLLTRYARRKGSGELAEDIVQEVFLQASRAIGRFETKSENALSNWLFRITHNVLVNAVTRDKPTASADPEGANGLGSTATSPEQDPLKLLIARQDFSHKLKLVRQLRPSQREALLLGANDYSLEEIAAICGVSIPTVKSRMFRGRENLGEWKKGLQEAA